ncbi:MAG: cysQ [Rickettsiaceae bacterium]|jgi:3'(2'), 5'-bisphosphate nucleotidase|nr:cysQ [Rickettsiaceae bacterium]
MAEAAAKKADILNQSQIKAIVKTALEAGEIAMSHFGSKNLDVKKKADNSPLTIADSLISDLIFSELEKIAPHIPVICEERQNRDFDNGIFWLIDPIDGTSSFANSDAEFTINIALIKNQKPVFGLIYAPAIPGLPFYYTNENGDLIKYNAKNQTGEIFIPQKKSTNDFAIIASKRSADKDILEHFHAVKNHDWKKEDKLISVLKCSSSLKFLYLIEGRVDLYLHLRRSMEWDIAAGHALLLAAGGKIEDLDGEEFLYGKAGLVNKGFLASLS